MTDADPASPAEARLDEHMELVRVHEPEPGPDLVTRIVRTVRWQTAVRPPLRVVGMIASAMLAGLAALLGGRGHRR